jgi:hypothetical protein
MHDGRYMSGEDRGSQASSDDTTSVVDRLQVHLCPFFGKKGLSEITPGLVQDYRMHRARTCRTGKSPSRSAMHHEIVTLRQVLKIAIRQGWIQSLPDMSMPYRKSGKVEHRGWFSPGGLDSLRHHHRSGPGDRRDNP